MSKISVALPRLKLNPPCISLVLLLARCSLGRYLGACNAALQAELQTGNGAGIMFYQCRRADRRDLLRWPRGCRTKWRAQAERMQHNPPVGLELLSVTVSPPGCLFDSQNTNITRWAGVSLFFFNDSFYSLWKVHSCSQKIYHPTYFAARVVGSTPVQFIPKQQPWHRRNFPGFVAKNKPFTGIFVWMLSVYVYHDDLGRLWATQQV